MRLMIFLLFKNSISFKIVSFGLAHIIIITGQLWKCFGKSINAIRIILFSIPYRIPFKICSMWATNWSNNAEEIRTEQSISQQKLSLLCTSCSIKILIRKINTLYSECVLCLCVFMWLYVSCKVRLTFIFGSSTKLTKILNHPSRLIHFSFFLRHWAKLSHGTSIFSTKYLQTGPHIWNF